MLPIHKNTKDPLSHHRSQTNATYNNIPKEERDKLVTSLLQEQKSICCYCMGRIKEITMHVEHWQAQTTYPKIQIEYGNLLAVCSGNKGNQKSEQHCDTKKGDACLLYNPANPAHHALLRIKYTPTGEVRSDDVPFDEQLNSVLNLNYHVFKAYRKEVFETVNRKLSELPRNAPKERIQKVLDEWQRAGRDGSLPPYAGVAIYFLAKRLKQAT